MQTRKEDVKCHPSEKPGSFREALLYVDEGERRLNTAIVSEWLRSPRQQSMAETISHLLEYDKKGARLLVPCHMAPLLP